MFAEHVLTTKVLYLKKKVFGDGVIGISDKIPIIVTYC